MQRWEYRTIVAMAKNIMAPEAGINILSIDDDRKVPITKEAKGFLILRRRYL